MYISGSAHLDGEHDVFVNSLTLPRSEKAILHQRSPRMVRWKASDLGIPTAPATQGGAGLERNMRFHKIIVGSHLTSVLGGQLVRDRFLGEIRAVLKIYRRA